MRTPMLAVLALAAALAGCVDSNQTRPAQVDVEATARELLASGRLSEAADEYLRLAGTAEPDDAQMFRLDAAAALIAAGELDRARELLSEVGARQQTPEVAARRYLLAGEVALASDRPAEVLDLLDEARVAAAPAPIAARMHELRARASDQLGNYLEAARERVLREPLLADPEAISENRLAIWWSLSRLPIPALEAASAPPPDVLGGWVALTIAAKRSLGHPERLEAALSAWRTRYPGHPAGPDVLATVVEQSRELVRPPATVALLLPSEGPFAEAGRAVRDGFIAAWFDDADPAARPRLLVRDSNVENVAAVYAGALEEGAEFVVGPLSKSAVNDIARNAEVTVPTLVLNHVDAAEGEGPALPEQLYQFSLAPEEEARSVAERAWFDGYGRVAVIAPEGSWGSRVVDAFVAAWESQGGIVLEVQSYPSDAPDMSGPVVALLDIDESEQRARTVGQVLRAKIHEEPRRRQDVDFVFMASFPRQARQLRPQFEFHRAGDVPIYATSHVYAGTPQPEADGDLDGVAFGDMPWVLDVDARSVSLKNRIQTLWPQDHAKYVRLYGFGYDAYALVTRLAPLAAGALPKFAGVTGALSIDASDRHVRRDLSWARFEDGVPKPLAPADLPR